MLPLFTFRNPLVSCCFSIKISSWVWSWNFCPWKAKVTESSLKYDLSLGDLQLEQEWRSGGRSWQMTLMCLLVTKRLLHPQQVWLALPTTNRIPIWNPVGRVRNGKEEVNQSRKRAGVGAMASQINLFSTMYSCHAKYLAIISFYPGGKISVNHKQQQQKCVTNHFKNKYLKS